MKAAFAAAGIAVARDVTAMADAIDHVRDSLAGRSRKARVLAEGSFDLVHARARYDQTYCEVAGLEMRADVFIFAARTRKSASRRHLMSTPVSLPVKAIAFYLPQYQPPFQRTTRGGERDSPSGGTYAGARPLFPGHRQPHVPYDTRVLRSTTARGAPRLKPTLAAPYGVGGFCYYHYWFNGRRILDRPFRGSAGVWTASFSLSACAGQTRTGRAPWDGGERTILLEQTYSAADDIAHIRALLAAFADER